MLRLQQAGVDRILGDRELMNSLREWTSVARPAERLEWNNT